MSNEMEFISDPSVICHSFLSDDKITHVYYEAHQIISSVEKNCSYKKIQSDY